MAPKGKSSQREDLKQEDVLQAVVLADSFNVRFAPITREKPRVLLPLVNIPILDYTLEFLLSAGVQEVFVFCSSHAKQIKQHLKKAGWLDSSSCSVTPVVLEGCFSLGDALRDIDNRSLIRNDFILVFGDTVANVDVQSIMAKHKKRRQNDKSSVMTLVLKHAPFGHQTRCREDDVMVATVKETSQVLYYQKVTSEGRLPFRKESLTDVRNLEIHYDLLDCQMCVCTPQVVQLFTDNFDYQTRDDFVRGILINEEILGNTIHIHIVEDHYAARVSNLYMYDAVSKDILNRWTYPHVPDNIMSDRINDSMSFGRHNIYLGKDITLRRGCILKENVLIGHGSSVGSGTVISQSVIGRHCKIGENVKIEDAYLWDDIVVGDGCTICSSILCDGVILQDGVQVGPHSVLSWQVNVGIDVCVKPGSKLTREPMDDGFGESEEPDQAGEKVQFGPTSETILFCEEVDSEDEEERWLAHEMWQLGHASAKGDDGDSCSSSTSSGRTEQTSPTESPPPDDMKMFYGEMVDTMTRAREEHISIDNLILEINSLKHAYNIAITDVNMLVTKSLLELPLTEHPHIEGIQLLAVVKANLIKYKPLLRNYIKSAESQHDCLVALEDFGLAYPKFIVVLAKLLHILYETDVLEEAPILKWFHNPPTLEDPALQDAIRKQVAPLAKWLEETEEESDDQDDD